MDVALRCVIAGLPLIVAACGGDPVVAMLEICPHVVYTGLVPSSAMAPMGNQFSVRVLAVDGMDLKWGSSNTKVATAVPDPTAGNESVGLITATGVGVTRVNAIDRNGVRGEVTVSVKEYPPDSDMQGSLIYDAHPCSGCHDSPGQSNVTSSGVSDNTDEEVIAAVTMGIKPEGGMLDAPGHMFALNDIEKIQIVAFLRSIV